MSVVSRYRSDVFIVNLKALSSFVLFLLLILNMDLYTWFLLVEDICLYVPLFELVVNDAHILFI